MTIDKPSLTDFQLLRTIVSVRGADAASFLQNLITNDIHRATPQQTLYAAMLNPQGRFVADLFISFVENAYWLEIESAIVHDVVKKLQMYKLRAKVEIMVMDDVFVTAHMQPSSLAVGTRCETDHAIVCYVDPRLSQLGTRMLTRQKTSMDDDQYQHHLWQWGVPNGQADMPIGQAIILECGLHELNALSWTKGCYIGQELMSRTFHRGQVRKRLLPVTLSQPLSNVSQPVLLNQEEVGVIRRVWSNKGMALLQLAAVDAALQSHNALSVDGVHLRVHVPSWLQRELGVST